MDTFRKWFYAASALASAVVPILVTLGIASNDQGNQWLTAIAAITGLLGTAGAGTAAVVLNKQQKTGVLETVAPADQVINGLQAVQDQATSAQTELARATAAVRKVASSDLVQQAIDSVK